MAIEATEGIMIWDGKSKGTYLNMLHLQFLKKPITLFLPDQKAPVRIKEETPQSLRTIASRYGCSP